VTRRVTPRTNEVFSHESANARLSVPKLVRLALRRCVIIHLAAWTSRTADAIRLRAINNISPKPSWRNKKGHP